MVDRKETSNSERRTKLVLQDNELRDINNYLKSGLPLPEKYRFLLFDDKREVELVWNGKTGDITNLVLPFQKIEQVDEPRKEKDNSEIQKTLFDTDTRGRQIQGWVNKLIWGDNKLILSSLKNGPLKEEIEKQGGIKLVYIDPPFSAGQDYSIPVEIGSETDEKLTKEPSVIENFAYRNTWGLGGNTFMQMLYERISLIRDLLRNDGVLVLRIDFHWGHYIKTILDEIFGKDNFRNEIVINRTKKNVMGSRKQLVLASSIESLFVYSKSEDFEYIDTKVKRDEIRPGFWRHMDDSAGKGSSKSFFGRIMSPPPGKHFKYSQEKIEEMIKNKKIRLKCKKCGYEHTEGEWKKCRQCKEDDPRPEYWVEEKEFDSLDTNWTDIPGYSFSTNYPTENSEILLERVIKSVSNDGDLIADFFCGSGTTLAAAEKTGRKWIGADLGKFAIHTTRKRMINVQRELKQEGKNYRAFEILNLGKYERQHYIGINPNLRDEEKQKQLAKKEEDFVNLILHAYKAEKLTGFRTFVGRKMNHLVAIGPINMSVNRLFVLETINEAVEKKVTKVDVLGFEFEMGLFPHIQEEAKDRGVDLYLKHIPREVFDKRAIEKNQVVFTDVSYIEVKPHYGGDKIAIELTDFSVFYNQDSIKNVEENLQSSSNKLIVENGNIIKISKDKNGIVTKESLIKRWSDWVDYWAVDFDFESKKEFIKLEKTKEIKQEGKLNLEDYKPEYEEFWTGDYVFENEWQSFRTKKDRTLEFKTPFKKLKPGRRKIAIKVVDIFGNDTMKIIEIDSGRSK